MTDAIFDEAEAIAKEARDVVTTLLGEEHRSDVDREMIERLSYSLIAANYLRGKSDEDVAQWLSDTKRLAAERRGP